MLSLYYLSLFSFLDLKKSIFKKKLKLTKVMQKRKVRLFPYKMVNQEKEQM